MLNLKEFSTEILLEELSEYSIGYANAIKEEKSENDIQGFKEMLLSIIHELNNRMKSLQGGTEIPKK